MSEPARELFPEETVQIEERIPMFWHGFLARFMLWTTALIHVFQAVWIILGKIYYEAAIRDAIYAGLPALRIADYALAAVLICAAVLQPVAAILLLRRKKRGISCLMAAYIMLTAAQPVHALARFAISGLPPIGLSVMAQTAAYLALLLVNASYYRKRRSLFG